MNLMKQKYEYKVARPSLYKYDFKENVQILLDSYAKEGWSLKACIPKSDDEGATLFIFERFHPEYQAYNTEITQYINEAQ